MPSSPRRRRAAAVPRAATDHRTRVGHARRARTRARIVDAAAHVFAEKGAEGAVIDDFVLAAGVSRGTFYNYFRTISELLEATVAWMADDLTHAGEPQVASIDDVVLRLATAMRLHLRWASLNRKWCAFMARIPNAATVGAVAQHHLVRDLIQGRKSAAFEFPSVEAALDLAVGGPALAIQRMAASTSAPQHADDIVQVVLQGLGVKRHKIREVMKTALPPLREPTKSRSLFSDQPRST
jgi:AcrR family transcriptional regulator